MSVKISCFYIFCALLVFVFDPVLAIENGGAKLANDRAAVRGEESGSKSPSQLEMQKTLANDGLSRQELVQALAALEVRTRTEGEFYLPPTARMTQEMDAYYKKMVRGIERCGTKFFPTEERVILYGKGIIAMHLNRLGNLVKTEVVVSSGEKLLDNHMKKIVQVAAPFGQIPSPLLLGGEKPFRVVVVPLIFNFSKVQSDLSLGMDTTCGGN